MNASRPSILFIGTGKMGHPMALRLLAAGYSVAVADAVPAALARFDAAVPRDTSPAALPGDVVITMLPSDVNVSAALFEPGGALERPRVAVIDMSSSAPAGSRRIAARLAERGIDFLDAPVSGGVGGATAGTLSTMIGGSADVLERYRPVLTAMCGPIVHAGGAGAGTTMKALNNFLSAVSMWAASEALVVGSKCGLDPATMLDVWGKSSGMSHAVNVKMPQATLPRTFDYGFSVGLMAKDLVIADGVARDADVTTPLMAETTANWAKALVELGFDSDVTSVITLIERWSHFEVPAVPKKA